MSPSPNAGSFVLALVLIVGSVLVAPGAVARARDDKPPFEMRFPQEVHKTTFSDSWGARRSGGRRHKGTDLMADKMTEVYAIADGTVVKVNDSPRAGRYVILEHQGGWESYYIHLNNDNPGTDDGWADWSLTLAPGVEEGALVVAGQLLAWVGDSGNAEGTGSHTHFELLHSGRQLNPYPLLEEAFARDKAAFVEEIIELLEDQLAGGLSID